MKDYAKIRFMDGWLRHPVMGDPSFDTFERLGETVHRSEPPYEWAVNGSIFRDSDDTWYYYAGLYHYGYQPGTDGDDSHFEIYRSSDRGKTWEHLGRGLTPGYRFAADKEPSDTCPDAVLCYDKKRGKYLLTYDCATRDFTWATAHDPDAKADSGAALAWADSPAGPFERLPDRFISCRKVFGSCGRFDRMYASVVFPRENDYLALALCDSGNHFAWGLAAMTAPAPEGPWSEPHIVLSCDRPEYYPCPVEFFPAMAIGNTVYASATSVARNRNYQALFTAPLEEAHDPGAWKLENDGNLWHAHEHPDEHYGIWGQTYHGFVEPDTNRYVVMFPSKDRRNYGTLSTAARPWDEPFSDGFTMTAHEGASVSPLLAAYQDFSLDMKLTVKGTADIAFDYHGILGPDDSTADSVCAASALCAYTALRIHEDHAASVVIIDEHAEETVLGEFSLPKDAPEQSLTLQRTGQKLLVSSDGTVLWEKEGGLPETSVPRPLALILKPWSRIKCEQFALEGEESHYTLTYRAADALLGAGQLRPDKKTVAPGDDIKPDVWARTADGYIGEGRVAAKWNVIGDTFEIPFTKAPGFGTAGIWIDGNFHGSVELSGEGTAVWKAEKLSMGRHAVRVEPLKGRIPLHCLNVSGTPLI